MGTNGGVICSGATGADGFTSALVFATAGRTGLGSIGAGGAGSFCAGVLLGAMDTGAGATGAGSCGFGSGCASGFFSGMGSTIDAGSVRGAGKSTCAAGTGVSLLADVAGAAGGCLGWPTAGAAGRTAARSWRWRSATSRWKETCCLEFSSLSWSRFSRSFLYFPSRTRVINGVASARSANSTKISSARGMGYP